MLLILRVMFPDLVHAPIVSESSNSSDTLELGNGCFSEAWILVFGVS
jgi:hypothetical protein